MSIRSIHLLRTQMPNQPTTSLDATPDASPDSSSSTTTLTPPAMPPRQVRRNERLNYAQLIWATPYIIILQQFIPVLATRLGASALLLGALSSGAALMLTISAAVGRVWLQRAPTDMRAMVLPVIGARSIVLWVPLVLLLPAFQAEVLVAVTILSNFFLGVVQVVFFTVLPRMTLPERVSTLLSSRWTVLGIGMTVGIPLTGLILDAFPRPYNYMIACGIALLTSVGESITYMHWRPAPTTATQHARRSARADLQHILSHAPGARYLLLTLLMQFGASATAPLLPLQLVRNLNASNVEFGWYSAIYWLSIALTGWVRPRLIQRYGNGRLFALSAFGLGCEALILGLAQSLPVTWLAGAIGGMSLGLMQVTAFGLIMESAPPDSYDSYVSVQTSVGNFAIFAAPLFTSVLLSLGLSIGAALLLCAGVRAAAGAVSWQMSGFSKKPDISITP